MKLSVCRIVDNQLRATPILGVNLESSMVKTFTFKDKRCMRAEPGQFLMLWIPGVDEIPLSIADVYDDGIVSVAVKKVGEATQALHSMKARDIIGVRGPFGNSFTLAKGKVLLVGGGTGIAPLVFLAKRLMGKTKMVFVIGAKTKEELLYISKLKELCGEGGVVATTEDGSYGLKCLVTEPLETLLTKEKLDMVYSCGPEKMMLEVFQIAENHGAAFEASLERLMRCAIGLCGSCVIGKHRVCKDGPVFTAEQLREVEAEFGVSKRDFDGKRVPL